MLARQQKQRNAVIEHRHIIYNFLSSWSKDENISKYIDHICCLYGETTKTEPLWTEEQKALAFR